MGQNLCTSQIFGLTYVCVMYSAIETKLEYTDGKEVKELKQVYDPFHLCYRC